MSSFWWNFHHWLHWKLSKWQLPVQPVIKISSKWQHFRFSEWVNTHLWIHKVFCRFCISRFLEAVKKLSCWLQFHKLLLRQIIYLQKFWCCENMGFILLPWSNFKLRDLISLKRVMTSGGMSRSDVMMMIGVSYFPWNRIFYIWWKTWCPWECICNKERFTHIKAHRGRDQVLVTFQNLPHVSSKRCWGTPHPLWGFKIGVVFLCHSHRGR